MRFENPGQNLAKKETLDDKWYEQFEKIAAFQDYEYFEGEKQAREE